MHTHTYKGNWPPLIVDIELYGVGIILAQRLGDQVILYISHCGINHSGEEGLLWLTSGRHGGRRPTSHLQPGSRDECCCSCCPRSFLNSV